MAWRQVVARVQRGWGLASPALLAGGGFAVCMAILGVFLVARGPVPIGAREATGGIGVLLLGALGWAWVTAASRPAPALTRSEIQWLITAPVSRRSIVAYRAMVTQPSLVGLAAVAALATVPLGPVAIRVGIGILLLLEFALANQLLAAVAQARLAAWGVPLPVRVVLGVSGFAGVWALVLSGGGPPPDLNAQPLEALIWLAERVEAAPVLHALARLPATGPWVPGALLALGGVLGCGLGIAVVDGPFEEHALLASRPADRGRRLLPLAPHGPLWRAFAWRGAVAVARQAARAAPALAIGVAGVLFAVNTRVEGPPGRRELQLFGSLVLGTFALAPSFVQQDLHADLRNRAWLFSLPVRRLDLVRGAVAGGALATLPVHVLVLLAAAVFVPSIPVFPDYTRLVVVLSLLALVPACVYVSFAVSNAMVVAWPEWLEHRGDESAGLENVGRLVGSTAIRNAILFGLLLPCAIAGAIPFTVLLRVEVRLGTLLWGLISAGCAALVGEWVVRRTARRLESP